MSNKIKCDKCGNEIELNSALTKDIQDKISRRYKEEYEVKFKEIQIQSEKEFEIKRKEIEERLRNELIVKVRQEYDSKIEAVKKESELKEKQNESYKQELEKYHKQLQENIEKISQYENEKRKLELDYQKKLIDAKHETEQKIKDQLKQEIDLKLLEKERQLLETQKQVQTLQQKLQQGSQQSQGEVLEEELSKILKNNFIYDEISDVPKGVRGADLIQYVKTNNGSDAGIILWELKNTKVWSKEWVSKLKQDKVSLKAHQAIIVTKTLPEDVKHFTIINGIYVSDLETFLPLALSIRAQLLELFSLSSSNKNMKTKAEQVYQYLASHEFKQRIEVWVEYFISRQQEIEKEKRYFMTKWQKEEKQIQNIVASTAGIYGDLKGLIGTSLPKITNLEID